MRAGNFAQSALGVRRSGAAFSERTLLTVWLGLIPVFVQQFARFFHACLPNLHHFFVVSLVQPAVVSILKMLPH
jgi:hypothetical protein